MKESALLKLVKVEQEIPKTSMVINFSDFQRAALLKNEIDEEDIKELVQLMLDGKLRRVE